MIPSKQLIINKHAKTTFTFTLHRKCMLVEVLYYCVFSLYSHRVFLWNVTLFGRKISDCIDYKYHVKRHSTFPIFCQLLHAITAFLYNFTYTRVCVHTVHKICGRPNNVNFCKFCKMLQSANTNTCKFR